MDEVQTEDTQEVTTQSAEPTLMDSVGEAPKEGEKPEGLDDAYWDAEKKAIKADELFNAYVKEQERVKGLRDKLARGDQKPPKDINEYVIEAGDVGKGVLKDGDPLIEASKSIAQELGLSKEMYSKFMGKMADKLGEIVKGAGELTPEQIEAQKAQEAENFKAEIAKVGPNGVGVLRALKSWGDELLASGEFNETEHKAFKGMVQTADDIKVLNKLRFLAGAGKSIPTDTLDDGLPSDREIADKITKAYEMKDEAMVREAEALLDRRAKAGRTGPLRI